MPQSHIPNPLILTVEDWLRTGAVGTLKPGDTNHDVLALLGPPPFAGPTDGAPIPGYWLYGPVEFGFSESGIIKFIQADTVNIDSDLHTCDSISIDWQGIYHNMTMKTCIAWLRSHRLSYAYEKDGDGGRLTVEKNSQLLFCDEDNPVLVTVWCPPMSHL